MAGAVSLVSPPFAESRPRLWIALQLRAKRETYREIGLHLGVSESRAHQMVGEAIRLVTEDLRESAAEVLPQELAALDELSRRAWARMDAGHFIEGLAGLKFVMERRAKYLGLDAPVDMRVGLFNAAVGPSKTADLDLSSLSVEELEDFERAEITRGRIMMKARKLLPPGVKEGVEVPTPTSTG
jgi:hypothetical protein